MPFFINKHISLIFFTALRNGQNVYIFNFNWLIFSLCSVFALTKGPTDQAVTSSILHVHITRNQADSLCRFSLINISH